MNYPMYQNPYYMPLSNPYQVSPYVAAMQQVYNQQQQPQVQQQQPQQAQQQITTQPPIMQPQAKKRIVGLKNILKQTNKPSSQYSRQGSQ